MVVRISYWHCFEIILTMFGQPEYLVENGLESIILVPASVAVVSVVAIVYAAVASTIVIIVTAGAAAVAAPAATATVATTATATTIYVYMYKWSCKVRESKNDCVRVSVVMS